MLPLITVALYALASLPVLYLVFWLLQPLLESRYHRHALEYRHQFADPARAGQLSVFPSVFAAPTVYVSFIVPAYNEEARLRPMLDETLRYLEARRRRSPDFTFEVIIVDDGSRDRTAEVALEYVAAHGGPDCVRLLQLQRNQGKGGAVQQGMLHARGRLLLMIDADGATRVDDFEALERVCVEVERDGLAIVVGSRAHLQDEAVATRSALRNVLMHGFHFLVAAICVRGVRDTQCGFKLFTRRAAQAVFTNQRIRRWSFDVELLFIGRKCELPIAEVGVHWAEIPGSKVEIVQTTLMMARDLVLIRLAYLTGFWKVRPAHEVPLSPNNLHSAVVVEAQQQQQ